MNNNNPIPLNQKGSPRFAPAPTRPRSDSRRARRGRRGEGEAGSILPVLLIVLILAILGGYLYLNKNSGSVINQTKQTLPSKTTQNPTSEAKITITKDGFIPSTITVAKGQQVTWINMDIKTHHLVSEDFDSDPLEKNDEYSYTFEKAGEYTYQDNTSKFQGAIIVK